MYVIFVIFGFLISLNSYADETRFGFEFTFTNPVVKKSCENQAKEEKIAVGLLARCDSASKALTLLMRKLQKKCLESKVDPCEVVSTASFRYRDKPPKKKPVFDENNQTDYIWEHKFVWKNPQSSVTLSTDPQVIEVTGTPLSVAQVNSTPFKDRIENLFSAAHEAKLSPDHKKGVGGGHIHVDYGAFKDHPGKALVFFNELRKRPNFFAGAWRSCIPSQKNRKSIRRSNWPQKKDENTKVISKIFDDWENCMAISKEDLCTKEAFRQINNKFYRGEERNEVAREPDKFRAFNVTKIAKEDTPAGRETLEIRSSGPQMSRIQWAAQIEVLEKLVEYSKNTNNITYKFKRKRMGETCDKLNQLAARDAFKLAELLKIDYQTMMDSLVYPVRKEFKTLWAQFDACESKEGLEPKFENLSKIFDQVEAYELKIARLRLDDKAPSDFSDGSDEGEITSDSWDIQDLPLLIKFLTKP